MAELAEGIITDLRQFIEAGIGSSVANLNAAKGDALLSEPQAFFSGLKPFNSNVNYPAVFFLVEETRIDRGRYNASFTDASHDVAITVAVKEADPEKLQLMLYRYGRILWELLVERFFVGGQDDDYPTIGPDSNAPEPRIVYEHPGDENDLQNPVAGPNIGKVHLYATVNKQEDV